MEKRIFYNYSLILKNIAQYLPSRILVILSSFFILPIFTHILDVKEVSIYLISLQILNLFCTCSFDWISKAILRFYEKYRLQNRLNEFFSTIFIVSLIIYFILGFIYSCSKNILISKFALNNTIFFLLLLLAIPCGIRQSLYQICRLKNFYTLYTVSIIIYQLLFITGFLWIVNYINNASAIIISMTLSIFAIDIILMLKTQEYHKLKLTFNNSMLAEIIKYGMPLIITNILYWMTFYIPNMILQSSKMYLSASIMGASLALADYTLQPFASLFSFINFPIVVKHYKRKNQIKNYHTSTVEMYLYILLPILFGFIFYSKEIASVIFPAAYGYIAVILPFIALKMFLHELLKLVNIKYHIQNRTYIEMSICIIVVLLFLFANFKMMNNYTLLSAVLLVLTTEIILFLANIIIKLKNENYISYKKVFKTAFKIILIILISFITVKIINIPDLDFLKIMEIILFFFFNYSLLYIFRQKVLL